jgi:sugar lactone lactonase YvrE
MTADDAARRLWVCAQRMDAIANEIWVFDLESGNRDVVLNLADAAADSTCNDIGVDSAGLAYISDSGNPRVYRADAGAETVTVWADDPLLSPNSGGIFGGNGIAVTPDDSFVIVSKTSTDLTPHLVRIALADPQSVDEIVTTPGLEAFTDGMSFLDGKLYIAMVAAGEVARLASDDDWATASVVTAPAGPGTAVPGISTVRPAEGQLYAIYSDITRALLNLPPEPPFRIFKIDLESFE